MPYSCNFGCDILYAVSDAHCALLQFESDLCGIVARIRAKLLFECGRGSVDVI